MILYYTVAPVFRRINADRLRAIFTAIIAITGMLAVMFAYRQLWWDHEESQVQHLSDFAHQFRTEPMIKYRKAYAEKRLRGVTDPDEEYRLLNFFESVGLLVNHGYLNDRDVWEEFSYWIFPLYADTRSAVVQEQENDPTEYTNFIALERRLEPIQQAQHGTILPSKKDLQDFWQDEATLVAGSPVVGHSQRHQEN